MACPRIGSTGLVKAVPVLCTGTSSQPDRILAQRLVGVAGQGDVFTLPAHAPKSQPDNLVAA